MSAKETHPEAAAERHLSNVAENLQLVADLGYGDVSLATPLADGALRVKADARPMTAIAAVASSRVGVALRREDELEAYQALAEGATLVGARRRVTRGIAYTTIAYPMSAPTGPIGVIVRDIALQVAEAPGKMEQVFMAAAEELLGLLAEGPLLDVHTREPFSTMRVAGDGLLMIDEHGAVAYASPNAVNIMRVAGLEGALTGAHAERLPGAATSVIPVLHGSGAMAVEIAAGGRVLGYRTIRLRTGALVLVEDVTDARRREAEIKVKEATIREVHHRVKNNLQTVASLLRIQARRSDSEEVRRALSEAMERVGSMAVVHDLLAASTEEYIDFAEAAHTVVDMVARGLAGEGWGITVSVEGSTGSVPAQAATSLALVIAELVHNAIEHGFAPASSGHVMVSMRRLPKELVVTVRDDGVGLAPGFDAETEANLGLAI
ncbi:MAG: histidine kinase N-terminal domain-containing protein, partial [Coriobacteriia bacterium]|nr:histidine kinase N-terminal domain-containing protein [Coriobacteriia bacterium]